LGATPAACWRDFAESEQILALQRRKRDKSLRQFECLRRIASTSGFLGEVVVWSWATYFARGPKISGRHAGNAIANGRQRVTVEKVVTHEAARSLGVPQPLS